MRFKLGNSTIRYIYDTHHLNIICIISYPNIFTFFGHYHHYNIYAIILIGLHRTAGPSRCLWFVIRNTFVVRNTGKTPTINVCCLIISRTPPTIRANVASSWYTYTKLSALHWYSHYFYLVYRIDKILRTKQGDCFYSPSLRFFLCEIVQFLPNEFIIVTSFVQGQNCVFVIAIVTCECAIPILQKLRFGVCHWY